MVIKILIDTKKCTDPDKCKKCLEVCPAGVFMLVPVGKHKRHLEKPPEHLLKANFPELCSLCMACVNTCPRKAINILSRR